MKHIIKPLLGNGKKVLANGADVVAKNGKNGLNGNGNGLARTYAKEQRALAKANTSTFVPEPEAGYVEPSIDLAKVYAANNRYQPGGKGPLRANRATPKKAAHSIIYSEAVNMKEAYPDLHGEIESWVRGGYAYARDKTVGTIEQPLKGYKPFIGPDGKAWRLKSKGKFGAGYRLSAIDKGKLKGYDAVRTSREKPWTNDVEMTKMLRALSKVGKAHKYNQLIQIMKNDFNVGMEKIRVSGPNMSKGHLISLDNGGLDVAENFMPQQFKNKVKIVDGKKVVVRGNPAMQANSTTEFASGRGVSSWDDYVRLKLHLL